MENRSLRASSPIWASEAGRARTRERAAPRSRVLARLASLVQLGELARRLGKSSSLARLIFSYLYNPFCQGSLFVELLLDFV